VQTTFILNDHTPNARDHKADCLLAAPLGLKSNARRDTTAKCVWVTSHGACRGRMSSNFPMCGKCCCDPERLARASTPWRSLLYKGGATFPHFVACRLSRCRRWGHLLTLMTMTVIARMRSQVGARCGHCCEVCLWHIASFRGDNNSVAFGSEPDIQRAALSEPNL
jgi:hypothetical protein